MNISLKEYGNLANKLNFVAKKTVDGAFKYVDKDTGDVISPYLLGKLYRVAHELGIEYSEQIINDFEYDILKQKIKIKELPKAIKEEIETQKVYIQSLKEEIQ